MAEGAPDALALGRPGVRARFSRRAAVRSLFVLMLVAVAVLGAWLMLGDPPDMVREPERREMQIDPDRFRLLSDADLAHLRSAAPPGPAAAPGAVAPAPVPPARPEAPKADPAKADAGIAVPSLACIEIGDFATEAAARRARARLAEAGVEEHVSSSTVDKVTRLHVSGVDASIESRIQRVLRDLPKQHLVHCTEGASPR